MGLEPGSGQDADRLSPETPLPCGGGPSGCAEGGDKAKPQILEGHLVLSATHIGLSLPAVLHDRPLALPGHRT